MLTSDLLVTRIYKGKIEPVYADIEREREIASCIIDIFQKHRGKSYGKLTEEIERLEEFNYRLVRGLAQLLERRCIIDKRSVIDPIDARKVVFEECKGFITNAEEKHKILTAAARKLSIKQEDLEVALWADHEDNLVLEDFQSITPDNLLRHYNLSLAQTLLFKTTGMQIQIEDNYQQVFSKIKQFGLIYSLHDGTIYLDGPVSLFKLTERYGTAIAKLLPTIMQCSKWNLKASIQKKTNEGKRIYQFTLDNTRQLFPVISNNVSDSNCSSNLDSESEFKYDVESDFTDIFDSKIEKELFQFNFNGWSVQREPTVLKAGQYAFIPDFSLKKNGCTLYIEVIGFWTPEYLKNKINKINQLEEHNDLILLVDKNLACSGSEFKTHNILFYDRKIPYLEIIRILRKYEEKQVMEEITKLRNVELSFIGDVINLDEIARKYGVSIEAVKKKIDTDWSNCDCGYVPFGNQIINDQTLKKIHCELNGVERYSKAVKVLENYGVKSQQILEHLGYQVKWNGLDPEDAEILKV